MITREQLVSVFQRYPILHGEELEDLIDSLLDCITIGMRDYEAKHISMEDLCAVMKDVTKILWDIKLLSKETARQIAVDILLALIHHFVPDLNV